MILQNLACFEIKIDSSSGRVYFNEDILHGKTIQHIWLFFSTEDKYIGNPFSGADDGTNFITQLASFSDSTTFLNVVDKDGKYILKNMEYSSLVLDCEAKFQDIAIIRSLLINRQIDTNNTFFTCFLAPGYTYRFLMYVSYTTKTLEINSPTIKGSFTCEIPILQDNRLQNFRLSDYIPKSYRHHKIKQIMCSSNGFDSELNSFRYKKASSYLELRADNAYIEHIPTCLLTEQVKTANVYFDNLKIDFENSFLLYRGESSTPTKESITFLY